MADCLSKNGLQGTFQKEVFETLREGRKKMRNLCILGGPNQGKSLLLKPLALIFRAYVRPDGGTYQLENILGKEVVFLNDFEFDDHAKAWMPWQYLKNFLEGAEVEVARPKNRGGNVSFLSDAPVFLAAPQEVALYRFKKLDVGETAQMRARIKYLQLSHTYADGVDRVECDPCGHCGARLYLEGEVGPAPLSLPAASVPPASAGVLPPPPPPLPAPGSAPAAKRSKTAKDIIHELAQAKSLKDAGVIDSPELKKLKDKLLKDE